MTVREYRKLQGMELAFVEGELKRNAGERTISYSVTFDMSLDFTHFVQMANVYIPGYLDNPINAIRPELDGLAYHYSYNYFFGAAGDIRDNKALFDVFTSPGYYMDQWSNGGLGLEQRYSKPEFTRVDGKLRITAQTDFRWEDPARQIDTADLPIIRFQWALNLLQGDTLLTDVAPTTMAIFMYAQEDLVEVEGQSMYRGTRYMKGRELSFGEILPGQILAAE
ncbi:hypothetical protein ACIOYV_23020 [Pseudomonas sp. NPDC087342]|uniref:hypothetical protein n=1 Tax=Pseudomonas sp. NPDC087342 TaxID=3364437 RepID=UPI0037FF1EE6